MLNATLYRVAFSTSIPPVRWRLGLRGWHVFDVGPNEENRRLVGFAVARDKNHQERAGMIGVLFAKKADARAAGAVAAAAGLAAWLIFERPTKRDHFVEVVEVDDVGCFLFTRVGDEVQRSVALG